jgi:hypothetical protein
VERRAPAALVILGELKVEALSVHPDGYVADARPGAEPLAQRPQRAVIRRQGAPGEAESCTQKLATLVEHDYSIT